MINITDVIDIHMVVPEGASTLYKAHTHGLEAFGHKEFEVLVPGFCRSVAAALLNGHADAVINRDERFSAGELGEFDGMSIGYEEVCGDFPSDPTRLRVVDVTGAPMLSGR